MFGVGGNGIFRRRQTVKNIVILHVEMEIAGKVDSSMARGIKCISLHLHYLHYLWNASVVRVWKKCNVEGVLEYHYSPDQKHSHIWYVVNSLTSQLFAHAI